MNAAERIRRGRSVRKHVIVALCVLLLLIPINFMVSPAYPWWMWAMMGWLPVMAAHTAWAMGLFQRGREKDN